jgi:hypothetical protein
MCEFGDRMYRWILSMKNGLLWGNSIPPPPHDTKFDVDMLKHINDEVDLGIQMEKAF